MYKKAHDENDPEHERNKELYRFYLDIVGQAYDLYDKWKTHEGFKGTRLRSIRREDGEIREVPDGIVFPIIASLSAFAEKTPEGWRIIEPNNFNDQRLILAATSAYMDIANHDPQKMGKSQPCYTMLYNITSMIKEFAA